MQVNLQGSYIEAYKKHSDILFANIGHILENFYTLKCFPTFDARNGGVAEARQLWSPACSAAAAPFPAS